MITSEDKQVVGALMELVAERPGHWWVVLEIHEGNLVETLVTQPERTSCRRERPRGKPEYPTGPRRRPVDDPAFTVVALELERTED